ncbi:YhdP family phospholipid transporter [Halomonas maura]|uniref:YhdP family phospholipid transporter n=1 Tax=Halomonas maura TaxID=117606 RepID=UPI0025B49399|nr:AsmA-like C-terminal region-containing protein [Halomonas maura]MDN3555588.1 AsmA-like C-terminal region-containing protein [Halomonas maura]
MSPTRLVIRWSLTLLALLLTLAAMLVIVAQLLLGQADRLTPRLEALLASRFEAAVSLGGIEGGMAGLDPRLEVADLAFKARPGLRDEPLLEIETARLRLDTAASLRQGMPVVADARLAGITLHLYQAADRSWQWPAPAELPPELIPESEFDLSRLDFWVGVLLRQRAWVEDVRVVLHGRQGEAVLEAPRLLMVGDERSAHLEGEVRRRDRPEQAFQVAMEVVPGEQGLDDFGAALQADMPLSSLIGLSELLGYDDLLSVDEAEGEARLWGRWTRGRLADVRLDIEAPRLALNQRTPPAEGAAGSGVVLKEAVLKGQWLRGEGGDDWQAWFEGDARNATGSVDPASGPPVPRYWHLQSRPDGWWLNASGFDLGALAAWRERLPLPEGLSRTVASLAPRGRVSALGLGRRDGQWQARVSATEVAVSPWQQAPGGGPLDIWLEADGTRGRVRFVDSGGAELAFPEIFSAPLALDHASGRVDWVYDGPRSFVSGRQLAIGWQGAEVEGGFGLSVGGPGRGGFGLQLDFRDVDAVSRPLTDWLPMPLLRERVDPELAEWLAGGLAGRVPEGALRLHVPVSRESRNATTPIDPTLGLALEVRDGHLPYAPGWPAVDGVEGRLELEGERLTARVARAESLGVQARDAVVRMVDETLEVTSPLSADVPALTRYLAAMPVDNTSLAADWQGDGRVEGRLALSLPLADPEALSLDISGEATLPRLVHSPTGLVIESLAGPLAWHQQGEAGVLEGRLDGRLLGGPVEADIDTGGEGIAMSGTAAVEALLDQGAPKGANQIVSGRLPWQARLAFGEGPPRLTLESALQGTAIDLPAPLGKAAEEIRPLRLSAELGETLHVSGRLGARLGLRWRDRGGGQGQVWLGGGGPTAWPAEPGWSVQAYLPRLAPGDWARRLSPLAGDLGAPGGGQGLARLTLDTDCLSVHDRCLGSLIVDGRPVSGGWDLALDGTLLAGRVVYREDQALPLDVSLSSLSLEGWLPGEAGGGGELFDELDAAPDPVPMPDWLGELPAGRLRVADIHWRARRLGPVTAYWRATPEQLVVDPVGLTLGEISAHGNLTWEATGPEASLTRARLSLDGRDLGSALEALGQPVAVRSSETRVDSQLAWPGAPWQFALARSRGNIGVELRDGRFVNLESPSARVVGLLNVDNLLRRLTLDFSDITGRGTAFDRVSGAATLYGGVLETRGPVIIDGPATRFTLQGNVDLARRELDQRLGVTVPVSNNLPLAAVIAGAPVVGGALFIADKIFGDAIDRVTRIHYRVQGPWTSPRISLESAE